MPTRQTSCGSLSAIPSSPLDWPLTPDTSCVLVTFQSFRPIAGEVTYHGPGQLLVFPLLDLRRQGRMVRETVRLYEQIIIDWVESLGMSTACRWQGEPGLYHRGVDGVLEKFAALGLRIRKGCTTHGLAINLDTDLLAFERINPCGHAGLGVTDLATLGMNVDWQTAADALGDRFDEAFQR